MKKNYTLIKYILLKGIFLILLPSFSFADTIVLKHSRPIRAEKVWEQDGHIFFYLHGVKMRVAKTEVHRIVSPDQASPAPSAITNNNKAASIKAQKHTNTNKRSIKVEPLPIEEPAGVKTKEPLIGVRWSGFRDLRWGIDRSTLGKLEEVETATRLVEIKEYVRANEELKMGEARLYSVIYAFWRHKLYAITLWVEGSANYLALRNEIFNRFGAGLKSDQNQERHLWSDRHSDRMLKYVTDDQTGLFWMRSKELDSLYRLSQIKVPSSYLEAMEARILRTP